MRRGRADVARSVALLGVWLASAVAPMALAQSEHTRKLSEFESQAYLIGVASDPQSGELLYTETWDDRPGGDSATVRYWGADGAAVAYKKIDFSRFEFAPNVLQADFRNRRGFEVARSGDELTVRKLKLAADAPMASPKRGRPAPVEVGDNAVVDAGFDRYVLANWDRLLKRSVRFDFLQIDKARLIALKIKKKACSDTFDVDVHCFSLNIDNLLLSRFVKPIELVYDAAQRRLLRYTGLGQLAGADGKGLVVQIDYRYRD